MGVSGLCTRVPGTVRVWCAAADTPQSTPGCVVWDAAETHKRPRPSVVFFSRQGEKSERSGITLPDTRGWSTQVTDGEWSHCPLGKAKAGARRRAVRSSVTAQSPVTKTKSDTCTTRERACAPD